MSDQPTVPHDPRPTTELFELALTLDPDSDARWDLVRTLQDRDSEDVLEAALALSRSDDPARRELAVDVLAQGQSFQKTFGRRAADALLDLLRSEMEARVLHSITFALGHHHDPRAIEPLARLKMHPDPEVRHAVTFALGGHDDDVAIQTLIELSEDASSGVRDWATFGLGSLSDVDTPDLRHTLVRRLADEDEDGETWHEAVLGLAKRRDERVFAPLLRHLERGVPEPLALEAAAALADPRLCAPLLQLQASTLDSYEARLLEDALRECGCSSRQTKGSAESP